MTKAVKLMTKCEHCNKPVAVIITKEQLDKMVGALRMHELLSDLSLGKHAYASGVNLNKKTVKEMIKNVK